MCIRDRLNGIKIEARFEKIDEPTPEEKFWTVTLDGNEVKVKDGEKLTKPADPTKEGYKFLGWFVGDKEFNFDTPITDCLLYTSGNVKAVGKGTAKLTVTATQGSGADAVKVTDTVKVTVTKDGGQTPQEDGKTPPKTGDETAPFFPFVLALAAGAVVMITRKKNG